MEEKGFQCDKCGLCCMGLDKKEITSYLQNGDGICRYLDRNTMNCTVYEERPLFCRVDEYYDRYLSDKMGREEYLALTYAACEIKKREWEACGGDISMLGTAASELTSENEKAIAASLKEAGTVDSPVTAWPDFPLP